jgi:hypothetical protein
MPAGMMRRSLASTLLATAVAACTTGNPPEVGYLPPAAPPVNINRAVVGQPRELVWTQVIDHLQQAPIEIVQIDEQSGTIVGRYRGNPEPYVTCGWIVTHRPGDLAQVPAAIQHTTLDRIVDGNRMVLARDLRLDGRIVVQVTPQGEETVVTAESTYVLTKSIDTGYGGSNVRGRNTETLSFVTGEPGEFEKGTICQPTGALELAALGALPVMATTHLARGVAEAREPPAAIETQPLLPFEPEDTGESPSAAAAPLAAPASEPTAAVEEAPAPTSATLECEGRDRAYCEMLEITAPYEEANRSQGFGLSIVPAGDRTRLEEGTELALDLRLPSFDSYVEVSYLQRDGTVGHILPASSERWPAGDTYPIRDTGYEIAEPFGLEMIVAIATEEPLFPPSRPRFEPIETYLADLRQRLLELRAAYPDGRIATGHVFVTTGPAASGSS